MILWDVNILVYAFRTDSPLHAQARQHLEEVITSAQSFLVNSGVMASFLRLVTNPRIFVQPSNIGEAWEFIDALFGQPSAVEVSVDPMTLGIFKHITLVNQSGGNSIPDDLLAAIAMRNDAVLFTADSGFQKYQGLQVELIT